MIDTSNKHQVSAYGDKIMIGHPLAVRVLTKEEALVLAAWLVALADPERHVFDGILTQIEAGC